MKLTVGNLSKGAVGIRPISGYKELERGGSYTGEFSDGEAANLRTNSLVHVTEGGADDDPAEAATEKTPDDAETETETGRGRKRRG